MSGVWVILSYTNKIFEETGKSISPNQSSIIVAVVQLAANFIALTAVDCAGRKILFVTSSLGTAFGFLCLGLYDYFKADLQSINWLSLVSFSIVILMASIGMMPLIYVIMAEVLPKKVKLFIL